VNQEWEVEKGTPVETSIFLARALLKDPGVNGKTGGKMKKSEKRRRVKVQFEGSQQGSRKPPTPGLA